MKDLLILEAVTERDIDLLLLEELHCLPEFRNWFVAKVDARLAGTRFEGAWRSITHAELGESDLVIVVSDDDGGQHVILVENKVAAPAQAEQAKRYRKRGQIGIDEGEWDTFVTCMVAPERYLGGSGEAKLYDTTIKYERLRDWFAAQGTERSNYKAQLLNSAIEQQRRGYTPIADEAVTAFRVAYYQFVCDNYPQLSLNKPGISGSRSRWVIFNSGGLPDGFQLKHKINRGVVDLEMAGCGTLVDQIASDNAHVLQPGMEVARASGSAAIRVYVPEIDCRGAFEAQADLVAQGLGAAVRLAELAPRVIMPLT